MEIKPLAIYIHIPFCVRKCLYCDFLSFPATDTVRAEYVKALCRELRAAAQGLKNYRVKTIFLGGGTPSLLSGKELGRIFETVYKYYTLWDGYDIDCLSYRMCGSLEKYRSSMVKECSLSEHFPILPEITIEANPGTLTDEFLRECVTYGVNRVSLGLQSANNRELMALGRIHRFEDFEKSFNMVRRAGIDNINTDLMSGLPGQSLSDWEGSLKAVLKMEPEHISAYSLIVEEGTPFYEMQQKNLLDIPQEDVERSMYALTKALLLDRGYERYEISNYARPGYSCRHNITYWKRGDYAGFGLGAASLVNNIRYKNTSDMKAYLNYRGTDPGAVGTDPDTAGTDPGAVGTDPDTAGTDPDTVGTDPDTRGTDPLGFPREEITRLSVKDQMEETMFLGLRMTEGVSVNDFYKTFSTDLFDIYGLIIEKYVNMGFMKSDGQRIYLTDEGFNVANRIMADFLLDF